MGTIVTITAPSLSGKSFLAGKLKERGMVEAVSVTTRPERAGEKHGEHYYFVSKDEFEKRRAEGEMVEAVFFNGNYYGLSKEEVEKKFSEGKTVVAVVEPNGAMQVEEFANKQGWNLVKVFLDVSPEVLSQRFLERFVGDSKASIDVYAKRLSVMMTEERAWKDAVNLVEGRDVLIRDFGPDTETAAIDEIVSAIAKVELSSQQEHRARPKAPR